MCSIVSITHFSPSVIPCSRTKIRPTCESVVRIRNMFITIFLSIFGLIYSSLDHYRTKIIFSDSWSVCRTLVDTRSTSKQSDSSQLAVGSRSHNYENMTEQGRWLVNNDLNVWRAIGVFHPYYFQLYDFLGIRHHDRNF